MVKDACLMHESTCLDQKQYFLFIFFTKTRLATENKVQEFIINSLINIRVATGKLADHKRTISLLLSSELFRVVSKVCGNFSFASYFIVLDEALDRYSQFSVTWLSRSPGGEKSHEAAAQPCQFSILKTSFGHL